LPKITITLRRERLTVDTVTTTCDIDDRLVALFESGKLTPEMWALYGLAPTIPPDAWQPTFPRPPAIGVDAFKIED